MSHRSNRAIKKSVGRAFSLIEVLLAVFILALGLLGLGAMVPAVIHEQRVAADATLGVLVADSAETYLKSRPDLNRWTDQKSAIGWGSWYVREQGNAWSADFGWEPSYAGIKDKSGPDADDEPKTGFNVTTGRMRLQIENNATGTPCFIRVQDRLWPDASLGGTQPRFVWDIVGRRIPLVAGQPRQVEIALFVRRIDPNIRVPAGATLYEVLTQQVPQAQWRVPVGVGVDGNKQAGKRIATLDGTGDYAKPFKLNVNYAEINGVKHSDWLQLDPSDAPPDPKNLAAPKMVNWQLFSRPGQKLVDNIGNIYTVVGTVPNPGNSPALAFTVQIDPPIPDWVAYTQPLPGVNSPGYRAACDSLRHVILTPQVPAAVSVFTVNIENLSQSPTGSGFGNVSP